MTDRILIGGYVFYNAWSSLLSILALVFPEDAIVCLFAASLCIVMAWVWGWESVWGEREVPAPTTQPVEPRHTYQMDYDAILNWKPATIRFNQSMLKEYQDFKLPESYAAQLGRSIARSRQIELAKMWQQSALDYGAYTREYRNVQ